jgi:hypothetical protein
LEAAAVSYASRALEHPVREAVFAGERQVRAPFSGALASVRLTFLA